MAIDGGTVLDFSLMFIISKAILDLQLFSNEYNKASDVIIFLNSIFQTMMVRLKSER